MLKNLENESCFGQFICILDKAVTPMDYFEDQSCVRLLGFGLDNLGGSSTVELYTFDIFIDDFYSKKSKYGNKYVHRFAKDFFNGKSYILMRFNIDKESKSYFYKSYSEDDPVNITIESLYFLEHGTNDYYNFNRYNSLALSYINDIDFTCTSNISISHCKEFELIVYSVGQGMCSLLHNGEEGYLLDAGAGKPVIRGNYQKKTIINELRHDITRLKKLSLILSHLDSDHFRIIRWDAQLLEKIKKIYIPSGFSWLDSKQSGFEKKVIAIKSISIKSPNMVLKGLRTKPQNSSHLKNDNELICYLTLNNDKHLLYPGDYTYSKIQSDKNPDIPPLILSNFDFVVVPHHGDHDSQYCIPSPQTHSSSIAFFSAGNHSTWNHPHSESVDEHIKKGFNTLICRLNPNIEKIHSE